MIKTLLTYLAVGLAVVLGLSLAFAILGTVLGIGLAIAGFLLFDVLPILVIGWGAVKLYERWSKSAVTSEPEAA